MGVLEVPEPAAQHRIETGDHAAEAVAARASGLFSDAILEPVQALFTYKALAGFEPVAEGVEAFPRLTAVADMRLVRMQALAIRRHPRADLRQGGGGLFAAF